MAGSFDSGSFSQTAFDPLAFDFGDDEPPTASSPIPWGRGPTRKQVANHLRRREEDALFVTGMI